MASAAIKGEKALAELAQLFDMHPDQMTTWKAQSLDGAAAETAETFAPVVIASAPKMPTPEPTPARKERNSARHPTRKRRGGD